jgi:hypothetical protein
MGQEVSVEEVQNAMPRPTEHNVYAQLVHKETLCCHVSLLFVSIMRTVQMMKLVTD